MYVKLLFLVGGWVGEEKTKLMLYSTLVEIEFEVVVEVGNIWWSLDTIQAIFGKYLYNILKLFG